MKLPLIDLQREINTRLKEVRIDNKDIEVCDKVNKDTKLPFIKLSDLTFNGDKTKTNDRVIVKQNIEVWSEYQGKKEAIEILTKLINKICELENIDLNEQQYIFDIKVIEGTVTEIEAFYKGYVSFDFTID